MLQSRIAVKPIKTVIDKTDREDDREDDRLLNRAGQPGQNS
jgi:hypothetical protein